MALWLGKPPFRPLDDVLKLWSGCLRGARQLYDPAESDWKRHMPGCAGWGKK